ncbi:MAG TPA: hypothetical protein VFO85_08900 [Vicinamibacteria bacterium]|nr:hypothetical protein [Vicinamibacteria bacterium]
MSAALMVPEMCVCGATPGLFVSTAQGRVCLRCWRDLGEPAAAPPTPEETERVELQWASRKSGGR